MSSHRSARLEETIRETLQLVIQGELRDPRLPAIFTVSAAKLTPDGGEVKVYFTQMPEDDEDVEDSLEMLDKAAGFLRTRLGQEVQMRNVPRLKFFHDKAQRNFERIEELLAKERKAEGERRKAEEEPEAES